MKRKKRRRKKKKSIGLGWGNPDYYGALPSGESGGLGESLLRTYISLLLSE